MYTLDWRNTDFLYNILYNYFQVLSIVLGMVLRALGPDRESDYDSDDAPSVPARLPLLRNQYQHGINYSEHTLPQSSDSWSLRILDKVRYVFQQIISSFPRFLLSLLSISNAFPCFPFPFRLTNENFLTMNLWMELSPCFGLKV